MSTTIVVEILDVPTGVATTTWTAPPELIEMISIEGIAGGASGGYLSGNGGAYQRADAPAITPGFAYTVTIGEGGPNGAAAAGAWLGSGAGGTSFRGSGPYIINTGNAGLTPTFHAGGLGADAFAGGGGGGAGGPDGPGVAGSAGPNGAGGAGDAGHGGAGGAPGGPGANGPITWIATIGPSGGPGGGGGGGSGSSSGRGGAWGGGGGNPDAGTGNDGGLGAGGVLILTYTVPAVIIIPPPPPETAATLPLRKRTYRHRLLGFSYKPSITVIKDRPGALRIIEFSAWMS